MITSSLLKTWAGERDECSSRTFLMCNARRYRANKETQTVWAGRTISAEHGSPAAPRSQLAFYLHGRLQQRSPPVKCRFCIDHTTNHLCNMNVTGPGREADHGHWPLSIQGGQLTGICTCRTACLVPRACYNTLSAVFDLSLIHI